jgi:hypothetical protein
MMTSTNLGVISARIANKQPTINLLPIGVDRYRPGGPYAEEGVYRNRTP